MKLLFYNRPFLCRTCKRLKLGNGKAYHRSIV